MIVFELVCTDRHRFEGWFASPHDFEGQKARGLLTCPVCSDSAIEKLLTAKIGRADQPEREAPIPVPAAETARMRLAELIDYILVNTEDVGREFPAEARRIHNEEVPRRTIRGVASREETEELQDEGIAVMSLPVPPQGEWH